VVPVATALLSKSLRDLTRRRARTVFTVLTIALGVSGMAMLAINDLADRAVEDQIEETRMYNVQIAVEDVVMDGPTLDGLGQVDNVRAVEARSVFFTRMEIGGRRADAYLIGIPDLADQELDVVSLTSGHLPGAMEVLTEESNSLNEVYHGGAGATFPVADYEGNRVTLTVTGVGKSLVYSPTTFEGIAVFYADIGTVRTLANASGYNRLSLLLDRTDEASVEETIEDVRDYLTTHTTVVAFAELPRVRVGTQFEGKEMFNNIINSLVVLTATILLASAFLISNTMNTIIAEQKREIGQMKAIGATGRQVFRSFLTTATIMGIVGAALGALIGVFVAYYILSSFSTSFGLTIGLMVHLPTVALSMLVGVGLVVGASMPALRRSSRVTVREALESHGIPANFGAGALDRALMRARRLPRSVQMGMRNVTRRKWRSVATLLQVMLAVGLFMAMLSVGEAVVRTTEGAWAGRTYDVRVFGDIPDDVTTEVMAIDGVRASEPYLTTEAMVGERDVEVWGYARDTESWDHEATMKEGRWFSSEDHDTAARVLVIGPVLARREGLGPGDTTRVMTATGEFEFQVVGVQGTMMDNGEATFAPLESMQDVLRTDSISGLFVQTSSHRRADIDAVATDIEDLLYARFPDARVGITYVERDQNKADNASIVSVFLLVSMLIVVISMVGLMSTLTMNVLDRTKEVGMLRCIGARAKDLWAMFTSEGVFIAVTGWLVGLPVGAVLSYVIQYNLQESLKMDLPMEFAYHFIPWAFLITVIGTALVVQPPLLRAIRLRPGDALRYQ
jgi:putative ABC transport system permease protein